MDWWESFFDADYIDAWTAAGAFESTAEQTAALVELLALPPGARVLDVGCGFGRFARQLHDHGYRVTGIDASDSQLAVAERNNPGPRYLRADMRHPPDGPYDAVVNLFSSFGYFADRADDIAALRAWFDVMRPDAVLVMELMHRDGLAHRYTPDDDATDFGPVREAGSTDWVTGIRTSTVTYGDISKTFRIRLYTATELIRELEGIGFRSVEAWGDLDGMTPLSPRTRLALRARR